MIAKVIVYCHLVSSSSKICCASCTFFPFFILIRCPSLKCIVSSLLGDQTIGFQSDDNELTMHFKDGQRINIKKGKKVQHFLSFFYINTLSIFKMHSEFIIIRLKSNGLISYIIRNNEILDELETRWQ
jgi:hypothetical protein